MQTVIVEDYMVADKQFIKVEIICVNAGICITFMQNMPVDIDNGNTSFLDLQYSIHILC